MMLMLGTPGKPSLLVSVEQELSESVFDFHVINGRWDGTYTNGHITVWDPPSGSHSILDKVEILTDNQDRLRHIIGEWREVFYNWDNVKYVAPRPTKPSYPAVWDDDIPF